MARQDGECNRVVFTRSGYGFAPSNVKVTCKTNDS